MVTSLLIIPPLAFNQSLNALVSQAMGSGNPRMAGTWLQLSVFWLTLSYIPVLASFFYVAPILQILGFSEELCVLSGRYAMFNVFWPIPNGWSRKTTRRGLCMDSSCVARAELTSALPEIHSGC